MQLKQIARDALLKPLQAVSGIVERRHTLPILANVLLEQRDGSLYVTATDLEMKITARAGRSRFNLQTLAAGDYPRIGVATEQLQSLSLPQKDLRALFKLVEFAMAQQDIRYYLNGMLLVLDKSTLQAVATDGHRLSWASIGIAGDFSRQEVILPRKTVLER